MQIKGGGEMYLGLDLFPNGEDGNKTAGETWKTERAKQSWA